MLLTTDLPRLRLNAGFRVSAPLPSLSTEFVKGISASNCACFKWFQVQLAINLWRWKSHCTLTQAINGSQWKPTVADLFNVNSLLSESTIYWISLRSICKCRVSENKQGYWPFNYQGVVKNVNCGENFRWKKILVFWYFYRPSTKIRSFYAIEWKRKYLINAHFFVLKSNL